MTRPSIRFVKIRSVSRGQGGSAVAKAAYVARERLRDDRTGVAHDYRTTPGLESSEILLPSGTDAETATWARDRSSLWNAAESVERRSNSRVAREYTIALPHELAPEKRAELARQFAQGLADRYGAVADLNIHGPSHRGDPRNVHAHILMTTRELTPEGFGRKTTIELGNDARRDRGLPRIEEEFRALRRDWAGRANEKLQEAGIDARLEPRSRAQINREAHADAMLRLQSAGPVPSGTAEAAADARSVASGAREARRAEPPSLERAQNVPVRAQTVAEIQAQAAQNWLAYKAARDRGEIPELERTMTRGRERSVDAGLDAFE